MLYRTYPRIDFNAFIHYNACMCIKTLLEELREFGLSDVEIAKAIVYQGFYISQPSVNRLRRGLQKSTRYDIHKAIIDLHNAHKNT